MKKTPVGGETAPLLEIAPSVLAFTAGGTGCAAVGSITPITRAANSPMAKGGVYTTTRFRLSAIKRRPTESKARPAGWTRKPVPHLSLDTVEAPHTL